MISTINTTSTPLSQNYSGVTSTESIDSDAASTTTEQASPASNDDDFSLSTRSQKLSAIDNEFFNGSALTSDDITTLVERLYEYGLISSGELTTLNGEETDSDPDEVDPTSAIITQSLLSYIDDLEESLAALDETEMFGTVSLDELQTALDSAKTIINDVATAKTESDFKQTVSENNQILTQAMDSVEFYAMSEADQTTLNDIVKTLTVIDKLSVNQLTNASVSQYIAISKL
ncbi:hypothetical protein [uncultured Psychrosphaera sp.]|uniref:hypothetical protein n=1 Tax=uncultured Psychrosphaera sp. TaxID=1403522 RepID=UPI0026039B3F|nr:hypothetical protein [uncultured Psychrosphaera sp.]